MPVLVSSKCDLFIKINHNYLQNACAIVTTHILY